MKIINKEAILKFVDFNSDDISFPAYSHAIIDEKIYSLKNYNFPHPRTQSKDGYYTFKAIVSGTISKEKGFMPNPMTDVICVSLESVTY